jgi:hypothetical protein
MPDPKSPDYRVGVDALLVGVSAHDRHFGDTAFAPVVSIVARSFVTSIRSKCRNCPPERTFLPLSLAPVSCRLDDPVCRLGESIKGRFWKSDRCSITEWA